MPRTQRSFEVGGIYHIIQRGVEKRKIFLKNQDYSRFVVGLEFFNQREFVNLWEFLARAGTVPARERIERERERKGSLIVELLGFALMPNHYHLIVREIQQDGISLFMRKMGGYSMYFNKQYERVGPLFQSRYKVVPIKGEDQLVATFVYVHTNPVELYDPGWKDFVVKDKEAAMRRLDQYKWSSYGDYTGNANFPWVTQRDFLMQFLGGEKECRRVVEEWIAVKARKSFLEAKQME